VKPSATPPTLRRRPRWDPPAIWAGALVALVIEVPAWIATSWALGAENWTLTAVFSMLQFLAFVLGGACAAWVQRLSLPLAHALVTAVGTYLALQVVISIIRIASGSGINIMNIVFFTTLALVAGAIGGALGSAMRRRGLVPSNQRVMIETTASATPHTTGNNTSNNTGSFTEPEDER
jgi:hypothetical protein